ncbi:unnamed protein product [Fraxinus pennsylvanica]|uniref:Pentatricopeptide repeat-containing protein n=1 Tax=Fraxinus pennsylvanica TaxID=56036 RepID=A0AAD2EB36_9LAMI|nr:unnamed protein product [Fraxinus pennsylvanica]
MLAATVSSTAPRDILQQDIYHNRSGKLLNGMEFHAFALENELDFELQVGNTLMDMYAKCTKISFMDSVFHRMPCKDYISWTIIIAGYVQNNFHMKALELFRKVQSEGMDADRLMIESILLTCVELDSIALLSVLSAAADLSALGKGKEIHGYMLRKCFVLEGSIASSLMDMHASSGLLTAHISYEPRKIIYLRVEKIMTTDTFLDPKYAPEKLLP